MSRDQERKERHTDTGLVVGISWNFRLSVCMRKEKKRGNSIKKKKKNRMKKKKAPCCFLLGWSYGRALSRSGLYTHRHTTTSPCLSFLLFFFFLSFFFFSSIASAPLICMVMEAFLLRDLQRMLVVVTVP